MAEAISRLMKFSALSAAVEAGETIAIMRRGRLVARLQGVVAALELVALDDRVSRH
jgi:antitoxin (DNA-binding transcriptional repressor) of toxin-antitoxin stability system